METKDEARRRAAVEVATAKREHHEKTGQPLTSREVERFQSEIGRRNERRDSERRGR